MSQKNGMGREFEDFSSFIEEIEREEADDRTKRTGLEETALVPVRKPLNLIDEVRESVIENAHYLTREDAEKFGVIVLQKPFGNYHFRVGVQKKLTTEQSRRLSRRLDIFSVSAIKFEILDAMTFDILLREAYEQKNLLRVDTRKKQQQTREKRVWGGTSEIGEDEKQTGAAGGKEVNFEQLGGGRLDISNLEGYYEIIKQIESGEFDENELETPAFVQFLLQDFSLSGASDLHIHSGRKGGRIRYRFQGTPYTRFENIPALRYRQIVNSLCSLAGKSAEKMNRQEVESVIKLRINLGDKITDVEFRFESLPSLHSPSVNLRGQTKPLRDITKVGFFEHQLEDIYSAVSKERGIVVITGPTGSGKTNTLNSIFAILEEQDDKVIVELGSPIEIESDRRVQITMPDAPTEKQADIFYQKMFKAVMRFDPDVIAFTEIRSSDEARITFRAANTGHLVFTTLHAADVEETFGAIFGWQIDRSVVAKGIHAIIAQTLIQKLCVNCRIVDEAASGIAGNPIYRENDTGCNYCDKGFDGRTVVAEVLHFNDDVRQMIVEGCKPSEIVSKAIERGYMKPMKRVAREKVNRGVTSESEVVQLIELKPELNADLESVNFGNELADVDDLSDKIFEAEYVDVP